MKWAKTSNLTVTQKKYIRALWNKEYPRDLSLADLDALDAYLEGLGDGYHILLYDESDVIKGWFFDFIRDGERWFAMILDASVQGLGWGSRLLEEAKKQNATLNGWVIDHSNALKANGKKYISPIGFYMKNDFKKFPEQVKMKEGIECSRIIWKSE